MKKINNKNSDNKNKDGEGKGEYFMVTWDCRSAPEIKPEEASCSYLCGRISEYVTLAGRGRGRRGRGGGA